MKTWPQRNIYTSRLIILYQTGGKKGVGNVCLCTKLKFSVHGLCCSKGLQCAMLQSKAGILVANRPSNIQILVKKQVLYLLLSYNSVPHNLPQIGCFLCHYNGTTNCLLTRFSFNVIIGVCLLLLNTPCLVSDTAQSFNGFISLWGLGI